MWLNHFSIKTGLPRSGKSQGKTMIFQGQGILLKVKENLRCLLKSVKSQGVIFLSEKHHLKYDRF